MGKLKELAITDNSKPYIMSYGINARDYHTLFEAVQGISLQVVVVARKFNIEGLEIPNNVKVLYNISLHECDKLVSNCLFTVFTFDGTEPSCGQISIVTSFMLGKPVICTDWIAVKDYVINDVNGLLVKMGNAEDLRNKMLKLFKDQKLYSCLSVGAQNWSKQHTDKLALQQSIDEVVTRLISPNDHNNVR
jgi:glycosyltransferase involved in cell wall biosynthesis